MRKKSHSLKALLNGNAGLKHLTAAASQMQQLHVQVCRQLPASLSNHCLGVQQQGDTLIIYMDNAASATLLRYQQRGLLSQPAILRLACKRIKVRVLPQPVLPPTPKSVSHAFPEAVRSMLERAAAGLEDGPLSRALRNLARGRNQRQNLPPR